MKHVVLLPERWKIGDVISVKARRVPSIQADRLTVCCAPNQQFLYPTATDFVDVAEDLDGHGEQRITGVLRMQFPDAEHIKMSRSAYPEQPEFQVKVPEQDATFTDVLICPRMKATSHPHRNWDGWIYLSQYLTTDGWKVGVAGKEQDEFEGIQLPRVFDLEKIASHMLKTKLVVATDSGLAHLAILLRVPLMVLWGSPVGIIPGQSYERGCHGRMESQKRAPVWHVENAWNGYMTAHQAAHRVLCTL